jgi:hypothetical protein
LAKQGRAKIAPTKSAIAIPLPGIITVILQSFTAAVESLKVILELETFTPEPSIAGLESPKVILEP